MSKTPNPFALAVDAIAAATALHALFEALKDAGFTEGQALNLVRDMARGAAGRD